MKQIKIPYTGWTKSLDIAPIPKVKKKKTFHLSHVMSCYVMSPVNCHLVTTLCSFSCYESSRRLGDAAAEGLVVYREQVL